MRTLAPRRASETAASDPVDMRILRRVGPYLWPRDDLETRARVVGAMALLVLAKLATVTTPLFFKGAVDALSGDAPADQGGLWGLAGMGAIALVIGYGLARLSSNGFQQLRDAVFAKVTQQALRRMAGETFQHIHALSLRYHLERRTGALSRVIDRGVKAVEFVLRFLLFSIAPLALELMLVAAILYLAFDVRFLLIVLATMAAYVVYTIIITEWRVKIRKVMNDNDNEASQKAIDSLLNYETVKYFGAEEREARRYDGAMAAYADAAIRTQHSLAVLNFGQALIVTSGLVALMALAASGVASGDFTVGDFVMVNAYMIQIMLPLGFLGTVYREIRQALIDMGDMFRLLDREVEVRDAPEAANLSKSRGEVAFDRVAFGYTPERPILHDVDFTIPPGKMLAVVGATGAGKSTIARLLYRFYDVSGGAIRIDGVDIREITQASLRAQIGVVPQDTVLFNDTIGYNLGYARADATPAEIAEAARAAQLDAFIDSLPEGVDTVVGERGLKLSGGEKQRVGIARALLKNPPILILDEATSALDSGTEREIQTALKAAAQDRTVIAIAHRLSTIVEADEILVLDGGRVAERGDHAALVAQNGLYAQMWRRQAEAVTKNAPPAETAAPPT